MRSIFTYSIIFLTLSANAQEDQGPRSAALGNSGVALQDVWSAMSNQAGLTQVKELQTAFSYKRNLLSADLSTKSAVLALPLKKNVFALNFSSYGFSAYSQQKAGISWAKPFGNAISLALNFNLHQVQISNYGSAGAFSAEVGVQYKPVSGLILGAHIANPGQSAFNSDVNEIIPVKLEFGASYQYSDKVLVNSAFTQALNSRVNFHLGVEYNMLSSLSLRGGAGLNPFRESFGFGYRYQKLNISAAASYHPALGYSPQIGLGYDF